VGVTADGQRVWQEASGPDRHLLLIAEGFVTVMKAQTLTGTQSDDKVSFFGVN
jgi:hypothetical protein